MTADLRAPISLSDLEAVVADDADLTLNHFHTLLLENPSFMQAARTFGDSFTDPAFVFSLAAGQRMLLLLELLDMEVKNGGITQFFFNRLPVVFEVREAFLLIGESEVLAQYDKALESLAGNQERWGELRNAFHQQTPNWAAFQETYGLLDLGWFDDFYYRRARRPNRAVEYIRAHPAEFITGAVPA